MESVKIEKLLEAYFEGTTSLAEEKILQNYFTHESVADHLTQYSILFVGFQKAKEERLNKQIELPESKPEFPTKWWYSVAALLVVALGLGSFYFSQPKYSQEEKDALTAFEESKNAMMLLSANLNKGAEQLTLMDQFEITKDKIFE